MLQIATAKRGRGGRRKLPLVFTEHGVITAANVPEQRGGWGLPLPAARVVHIQYQPHKKLLKRG